MAYGSLCRRSGSHGLRRRKDGGDHGSARGDDCGRDYSGSDDRGSGRNPG